MAEPLLNVWDVDPWEVDVLQMSDMSMDDLKVLAHRMLLKLHGEAEQAGVQLELPEDYVMYEDAQTALSDQAQEG